MLKNISGLQETMNNLAILGNKKVQAVAVAVEKTCIDVANHAKAGHNTVQAHANHRYINQTGTLTRSITPALQSVTKDEVVGIVHVSNNEYAAFVEAFYPFMTPALFANSENLKKRVKAAIDGNS